MNMSLKTIITIAAAGLIFTGCQKPVEEPKPAQTSNEFHFNFENYFGDQKLELNTATYTTAQNEEITVSTFNYWITNIRFIKNDGTEYAEPESYRLIRADKHGSMHFHVADVPAGTYTGIKFIVGVDKARNTSGAQSGALDPTVNGDMYWSWNTGYIQAKLEGTSPQSTATNNFFEYHIGGLIEGKETPQDVAISLPNNITIGEQAGSVLIKTDLAKWFPTPMSIAMMPSMTHPKEMAYDIAKGYTDMFSVTTAENSN